MFDDLLIRPDLPHMFLSDVNTMLDSIEKDFPGVAQVQSIGTTWEDREIRMLTIDTNGQPKKVVKEAQKNQTDTKQVVSEDNSEPDLSSEVSKLTSEITKSQSTVDQLINSTVAMA